MSCRPISLHCMIPINAQICNTIVNMDRFETKEFLRLVQIKHPRFKIDKQVMGIWYACFFEKPFGQMKTALKAHFLRCKFAPELSEINAILIEQEPAKILRAASPEETTKKLARDWEYRQRMAKLGLLMLKETVSGRAVCRYVKFKDDSTLWSKGGEDEYNGERLPFLLPLQ